jgi:hypothetical protein
MTSTPNPYVVDHSIHTEALLGFIKSKKVQTEATPGAKKLTPTELFAKYAADTNNFSHVALQATQNSLKMYTCYYLFSPKKLLECISTVKPGWRRTPEDLESGTMTCTSPDSPDSVLVPYPSDKVLWRIS